MKFINYLKSVTNIIFVSFFLYIYPVKIKLTILFLFIITFNLPASNSVKTDITKENISTTAVTTDQGINANALTKKPTIVNDIDGGGLAADDRSLNSILGYFILIFFSVLIFILIDNRNLERRYKKLASEFNNKEPLV